MVDKNTIQKRIEEIEQLMLAPHFWNDKDKAQVLIRELNDLKEEAEGGNKYDKLEAIVSILSGAGGDDAEDFSRMLFTMYQKYSTNRGWGIRILHQNDNEHSGYRNITFEIEGKDAYGELKHESGVHRLVRLSPFNAKQQRHTSFSLVEVIPKFKKLKEIVIPDDELDMQFIRSGGPGGQNVNKRETAVRIIHKPTNIAVHVDSERSQAQNKEQALTIIKGKLFKRREEDRKKETVGLSISSSTSIEWGNQIRSYVLHPYKLVKDHRSGVEVRDAEGVLEGNIEAFLEAERNLLE